VNKRKRLPSKPPPLDEELILEWADAHFKRTGAWPKTKSGGHIPESVAYWRTWRTSSLADVRGDTWSAVNAALYNGARGLLPGSSLPILLEERRGIIKNSPALTEELILEWADAHFNRTGTWPDKGSGHIPESMAYWRMRHPEAKGDVRGDKWETIATALIEGSRGLTPHSSLTNLLERRRGVLSLGSPPSLTEDLILEWADAYFARKGSWPTTKSGSIPESEALWAGKTTVAVFKSRCDNWCAIDAALRNGSRGLKPYPGLLPLLAQRRSVRNHLNPPGLELEQIMLWAREHHAQTGQWPSRKSGPIPGAGGETWWTIDDALKKGSRGLSGGPSLADLLADNGLLCRRTRGLSFSEDRILEWADSYHAQHGVWPQASSGPIPESKRATWTRVDRSLRLGFYGLPGGSSLTKLLERCRGKRSLANPPKLTEEIILLWADDHNKRHGRYPVKESGTIDASHDETWVIVDAALRKGSRGLPPGSSLSRLLAARRGIVLRHTDPLTAEQILGWADDHNARYGRYPNSESGPILAAPGRTWMQIHEALRRGRCGFPGGSDLSSFLHEHSRDTRRANYPDLTEEQILSWAQAFFARRGSWPTPRSGAIEGSQGDDWSAIDGALKRGARGLPQGSSLAKFLSQNAEVSALRFPHRE